MGPDARKEEARKIEESKAARQRRALCREAVAAGLREAVRETGLAEDIIRDEAMEKGVVSGGGIRRMDKADLSISRGIKMDSLPAWADHGRGRGRGGRGIKPNWARGGARGGYGSQGARGVRGRGGRGGGGGGRGDASKVRGQGGRGGRGTIKDLTGGNAESVPDRKGKRKLVEDYTSEEAKKVKLMELASESPLTSVPPPPASGPSSGPSSGPLSASASAASSAASSSSRAPGQSPSEIQNSKKKSLLGLLLTGGKIDAGKGFGLFD
jgi:hypothetical protein